MVYLTGVLRVVYLTGILRVVYLAQRLKETQSINKSLSALTDVFVALSKKAAHVPYRNSKLTFLLQPCLSIEPDAESSAGDGKALVIVNIFPVIRSSFEQKGITC